MQKILIIVPDFEEDAGLTTRCNERVLTAVYENGGTILTVSRWWSRTAYVARVPNTGDVERDLPSGITIVSERDSMTLACMFYTTFPKGKGCPVAIRVAMESDLETEPATPEQVRKLVDAVRRGA